MSYANSATVDVDQVRVEVQFLDVCQHDHTEGFVDLPHADVLSRHARLLQHLT